MSRSKDLLETQSFHGGKIDILIADRPCLAQVKAKNLGIYYLQTKNNEEIFQICRDRGIDLVCSAGWLRKLVVPNDFANKIINIHPSLLPAFGGKGMYGDHVHQAVYDAGEKITGCTVHFIDNEYDHGKIILQRSVVLDLPTTPKIIEHLVRQEEKIAYPEAVRWVIQSLANRNLVEPQSPH